MTLYYGSQSPTFSILSEPTCVTSIITDNIIVRLNNMVLYLIAIIMKRELLRPATGYEKKKPFFSPIRGLFL